MALDDKIAIVTGGSSGIGNATAARFLENDASVVIANRSEETARASADEHRCEYIRCDVSDYNQVTALVEDVVGEYDRLNVMVNNAGISGVETLEQMSLEDWHDVIQTNIDGVTHGSRAALPHFDESGAVFSISRRFADSSVDQTWRRTLPRKAVS